VGLRRGIIRFCADRSIFHEVRRNPVPWGALLTLQVAARSARNAAF